MSYLKVLTEMVQLEGIGKPEKLKSNLTGYYHDVSITNIDWFIQ